jgi:hypothetical protein
MAFSVTNTLVAGGTVDPDDLNENFNDIEDILNGGLTDTNISSDANITITKLAAYKQDIVLHIGVPNPALLAGTTATAIVSSIVAFPADSGVTWTITDVQIPVYYGAAGTAVIIDVCWGDPTDPANATRICNAVTIAAATAIVNPTPTSTSIVPSATKCFFLVMDATNAGSGWTIASSVGVTLKLTATLRT